MTAPVFAHFDIGRDNDFPRMRMIVRIGKISGATAVVGFMRGFQQRITCSHDSRGRERPGSLPHSGVLSAGGVVLAEDSDLAQPPSDKDARWHDRAPAER